MYWYYRQTKALNKLSYDKSGGGKRQASKAKSDPTNDARDT